MPNLSLVFDSRINLQLIYFPYRHSQRFIKLRKLIRWRGSMILPVTSANWSPAEVYLINNSRFKRLQIMTSMTESLLNSVQLAIFISTLTYSGGGMTSRDESLKYKFWLKSLTWTQSKWMRIFHHCCFETITADSRQSAVNHWRT